MFHLPNGLPALYTSEQQSSTLQKVLVANHLRQKNRPIRNMRCPKLSTFVHEDKRSLLGGGVREGKPLYPKFKLEYRL